MAEQAPRKVGLPRPLVALGAAFLFVLLLVSSAVFSMVEIEE